MTLALRNYGLVLPKNYVSIEKDEMEYIDGGGWLADKATDLLVGLIGCALWEYRATITKSVIIGAIKGLGYVTTAIKAAAGWVIANPVIALAILAGVVGIVSLGIAVSYRLN